jgi:hypothetical protein
VVRYSRHTYQSITLTEEFMRRAVFSASLVAAVAAVFVLAASASAVAPALTCSGKLQSGTYSKIVVPPKTKCNGTKATIKVNGNVTVNANATFILGSDAGTGGGKITGTVKAVDPKSVQLHSARVGGSVAIEGGFGFFSTVEDNVISGGAHITGYSGFWLGFIRNDVAGSVRLNNNIMADPDANEYVSNTIGGNLVCIGNSPAPQVGDSGGSPNVVAGDKIGQCASL